MKVLLLRSRKLMDLLFSYSAVNWIFLLILSRWERNLIDLNSNTFIKNSVDLVSKLEDSHIPQNSTLTSFDITNMYTNIPISETIDIIKENLTKTNTSTEQINEIIEVLKVITKQNYFTFENKFWSQEDGLPMGSPISSLLAEIYLQHYETQLIFKTQHAKNIQYWYRYVDDILLLYHGNQRQCEIFRSHLNKINKKKSSSQQNMKTINPSTSLTSL